MCWNALQKELRFKGVNYLRFFWEKVVSQKKKDVPWGGIILGGILLVWFVSMVFKAGEKQAEKRIYTDVINSSIDDINGWKQGTTDKLYGR